MSDKSSEIYVRIDGEKWVPNNDETAEYDAIHAVAGAVLAGATEVQVIRQEPGTPFALETPDEWSEDELERIKEELKSDD